MKLPQMFRNLWIYRRLIGLAVLLGIVLSFVMTNLAAVDVRFPFLGTVQSRVGIVMLTSGALGAAATWLVMTFRQAVREVRDQRIVASTESEKQRTSVREGDSSNKASGKTEGMAPGS